MSTTEPAQRLPGKATRTGFSSVDLLLLLLTLTWGVNSPILKASLRGWLPLAFNAFRFGLAALAVMAYVIATDRNWRLSRKDFWYVAALGVVGNGLYQFLYMEGLSRTTAANTQVIIGMTPLVVTVWGAVTGLDRISGWLVSGALISMSGTGLVILGKAGGLAFRGAGFLGDLLTLCAMFFWGAYTVYTKPATDRVGSPLKVTAWAMLFGAVVDLLVGLPGLLAQDYAAVPGYSWLGMAFSALLSLAACYVVFAWAVQRIGSARASLYMNVTPIISALFAWLLIGERWTMWQWFGAALVIAGVTVAKMEALRA